MNNSYRWQAFYDSDLRPPNSNLNEGAVRKLEKRRSSNLRDFVGSTPTRATLEKTAFRGKLSADELGLGWLS